MRLRALFVTIPTIALATTADAKCLDRPDIRATATVEACTSVTFAASDSKYSFGDGEATPLYKPGDKLIGTLLSVTVKRAQFVWADSHSHRTNGARIWAKGESRSLFVKSAASSVCPTVLPSQIMVVTESLCCDTIPVEGECLLPHAVPLVRLLSTTQQR
jgi:hypothetical protein